MNHDTPDDEQLSAYLDGELSRDERAEIERLLERDVAARRRLAALREIAQQFGRLPRESLSPHGAQRIASALNQAARQLVAMPDTAAPQPHSWRRPLAIAASLLLASTVLYVGMEGLQQERERLAFAPLKDADQRPDGESNMDSVLTTESPAMREKAPATLDRVNRTRPFQPEMSSLGESPGDTMELRSAEAMPSKSAKHTDSSYGDATPRDASMETAMRLQTDGKPARAALAPTPSSKPATSQPATSRPSPSSQPTSRPADKGGWRE